jgi:porphobilinogen synthase
LNKIIHRHRRLRKHENLRSLIRETSISPKDLISPLFVIPGKNIKNEVTSMPGVFQLSRDNVLRECEKISSLSIPGVILFGIPEKKDPIAREAYSQSGIIQKTTEKIKKHFPDLLVITDLCFCEYTDHGHCGIYEKSDVNNDKTLDLIHKTAISQANSGSDLIAPSSMTDGMVGTIRKALDETGFTNIPIMSYSAKYHSSLYGPFRDAALSSPSSGNRKTYQMDPANSSEALREVEKDIIEGADIIMIKPALTYLDIIRRVKDGFNIPISAFFVSGEYSMIKASSQKGWIDEKKVIIETHTSIKRAGADFIITYFAKDLAECLKQ